MAGPETILIVDDDLMTLKLTSQIVERLGWKPITADSGEEAIRLLSEPDQEISLVLLDLAMPNLDGFGVASHIRQELQLVDLPIVALTARVEFEMQSKARTAGIDDIVYKPFEVRKLKQTLDKYLN